MVQLTVQLAERKLPFGLTYQIHIMDNYVQFGATDGFFFLKSFKQPYLDWSGVRD